MGVIFLSIEVQKEKTEENPTLSDDNKIIVKRNIKEAEKKLRKNKCPRCGGKLKKKKGKYGKFKRCKNYPECTFKINI